MCIGKARRWEHGSRRRAFRAIDVYFVFRCLRIYDIIQLKTFLLDYLKNGFGGVEDGDD